MSSCVARHYRADLSLACPDVFVLRTLQASRSIYLRSWHLQPAHGRIVRNPRRYLGRMVRFGPVCVLIFTA